MWNQTYHLLVPDLANFFSEFYNLEQTIEMRWRLWRDIYQVLEVRQQNGKWKSVFLLQHQWAILKCLSLIINNLPSKKLLMGYEFLVRRNTSSVRNTYLLAHKVPKGFCTKHVFTGWNNWLHSQHPTWKARDFQGPTPQKICKKVP